MTHSIYILVRNKPELFFGFTHLLLLFTTLEEKLRYNFYFKQY